MVTYSTLRQLAQYLAVGHQDLSQQFIRGKMHTWNVSVLTDTVTAVKKELVLMSFNRNHV